MCRGFLSYLLFILNVLLLAYLLWFYSKSFIECFRITHEPSCLVMWDASRMKASRKVMLTKTRLYKIIQWIRRRQNVFAIVRAKGLPRLSKFTAGSPIILL